VITQDKTERCFLLEISHIQKHWAKKRESLLNKADILAGHWLLGHWESMEEDLVCLLVNNRGWLASLVMCTIRKEGTRSLLNSESISKDEFGSSFTVEAP
jgi:hypothetical protein